MNNLKLFIDQRENKIKQHFDSHDYAVVDNLDIGDFLFKNDDDIVLLVERKSITDLSASICDGRQNEQKTRILGSGIPRDRIMYIIEGNLDVNMSKKIGSLPTSTLLGSIINTEFRDGIRVHKTRSLDETSVFLQKLYEKLKKDGNNYWKYNDNEEITTMKYASTLKTRKKSNMTPETCFITQLCVIPGISTSIAESITKEYPSMVHLIQEYESIPEGNEPDLLKNIQIISETGKSRKLGSVISKRIYEYIWPQN